MIIRIVDNKKSKSDYVRRDTEIKYYPVISKETTNDGGWVKIRT